MWKPQVLGYYKLITEIQQPDIEQLFLTVNLRVTFARLFIANKLFKPITPFHFTIENLVKDLRNEDTKISLATVYNVINDFNEAGLLQRIDRVGNGAAIYDTDPDPHAHFFNVSTGNLTNIKNFEMPHLPPVTPPIGTRIIGMDIILRIQGGSKN